MKLNYANFTRRSRNGIEFHEILFFSLGSCYDKIFITKKSLGLIKICIWFYNSWINFNVNKKNFVIQSNFLIFVRIYNASMLNLLFSIITNLFSFVSLFEKYLRRRRFWSYPLESWISWTRVITVRICEIIQIDEKKRQVKVLIMTSIKL